MDFSTGKLKIKEDEAKKVRVWRGIPGRLGTKMREVTVKAEGSEQAQSSSMETRMGSADVNLLTKW